MNTFHCTIKNICTSCQEDVLIFAPIAVHVKMQTIFCILKVQNSLVAYFFFLFYLSLYEGEFEMKKQLILLSLLSLQFCNSIFASDDLAVVSECPVDCKTSRNFFHMRAFSSSSIREIYMIKTMYMADKQNEFGWRKTFAFAFEYMTNFGGQCSEGCNANLASLPFWSGNNTMTYGNNNGNSDLDAYQFGMGEMNNQGTISLDVNIMHVGCDLLFQAAHNSGSSGFYFTIRAPLGAMTIETHLSEKPAEHDIAADTVTEQIWLQYPSIANQYSTLTEAFQAGILSSNTNIIIQSGTHKPFALDKARFSAYRLVAIRMADICASIGYNFYNSDNGFISLGAKFLAPTGNMPTGRHVLEPIFGHAAHWGVGAEVTGHYKIWEDARKDRGLDFWVKGDAMHLRSGRRPNYRTFDLKQNGPGSKYLLIQKYFLSTPINSPTNPELNNPTGAIPSYITQAANITTLPVISRFNIEGTAAVLFDFHERNWNVAVGAEYWCRGHESLNLDAVHLLHVDAAMLHEYAVLGRQVSDDARNYLYDPAAYPVISVHLCEPLAKINKSLPRVVGTGVAPNVIPPAAPYPAGIADARYAANRIPADLNQALDVQGAATQQAMTAKLSTQFGYTWKECRFTPNLSLIANGEFALGGGNATINTYSVGAQGSVNF